MPQNVDPNSIAELKRLYLEFSQKLDEAKLEMEGVLRNFDQNLRERRLATMRKELGIVEKIS